jgi:hypothetical protein
LALHLASAAVVSGILLFSRRKAMAEALEIGAPALREGT